MSEKEDNHKFRVYIGIEELSGDKFLDLFSIREGCKGVVQIRDALKRGYDNIKWIVKRRLEDE